MRVLAYSTLLALYSVALAVAVRTLDESIWSNITEVSTHFAHTCLRTNGVMYLHSEDALLCLHGSGRILEKKPVMVY